MTTKLGRSIDVLRSDGPEAFVKKCWRYGYQEVYRAVTGEYPAYSLAIDDISVEFSTPKRLTRQKNEARFTAERDQIGNLLATMRTDDVFFDIGANTGLYTLFVAKRCKRGEVVAFEPYPPNVSALSRDVSKNDLDNVVIRETALSDSNGTVSLLRPDVEFPGYGKGTIEQSGSTGAIEVQTRTADSLVGGGELPQPTVIKIDVEGAETSVVDGMEETLSNPECRLVHCEVHPDEMSSFGTSPAELRDRLTSLGFTVEERTIDDSRPLYRARK